MNYEGPESIGKKPREIGTDVIDPAYAEALAKFDSDDKDAQFYKLYSQLGSAITDINGIDIRLIENLLIKICILLRLSKAATKVYKNQQDEEAGICETLSCYDNGKECVPVSTLRLVTSIMSIATITVYMSPDEEPLSEDEKLKVDLVMRTMLSFVSRNRLQNAVYELAYFDEAGYPNLRSWKAYLFKSVAEKSFHGKLAFRYNLRHFALINQEFGREIGNVVMKSHFDSLKEIVGENGYLARLGGDNFLGMCTTDKTRAVVDYLTQTEVRTPKGIGVNISTSAGFYRIPDNPDIVADEIMGSIINAYRVAQNGGMDSIVFYDESFLKKKGRAMKIQQMFPEALEKNEFRPFYQPKVNVMNGRLVGAEALCRWYHAGKVILPVEFIPVLEQTSEICRIDFAMLEGVCRDMRRWADEGIQLIRVSINFSRKHILNTYLAETIAEIVDRYSIPHYLIEIEFTETTSEVELSDLKRMVTSLRELDFSVSIDDFGIGYSSLNIIKDVPWTTIKIDRAFLPDNPDDRQSVSSVMFRHVVSMTRQLGLECISEGVETQQHVMVLCNSGCDIAQGYYFDEPLPVEEFEQKLILGKYEIM